MGLPRRLAVRLGAQALLVSIASSKMLLSLCLLCAEHLHSIVLNDFSPFTECI